MDNNLIWIFTALSGLTVALLTYVAFKFRSQRNDNATGENRPAAPAHLQGQEGLPRRAVAARNARARLRAAAHRLDDEEEREEALEELGDEINLPDGKIGKKKLAKLEAKAEKKAQREAELREREDRKTRQAKEEEERKKQNEREKEDEVKRAEDEKRAKEEQEKRDYEEYLKMKEAFSVEEEGYDENEAESEKENLLHEFVSYIKNMKVVVLEDLAGQFKLKTQDVIDRIQQLQEEGTLTGVVDDRGKFIYISVEELESVAKFVKQRGRVSLAELAESSNQLINLNPTIKTEA